MITCDHTVPVGGLILVLLVAVPLAGFSAWRFLPRNLVNGAITLLHLVVPGGFAWCLLMPGKKDAVTSLIKPRFQIAVDTSASMELTPSEQIPNRWTVSMRVLQQDWVDVSGALLLSDGVDTSEVFNDWAADDRPFPIHTLRRALLADQQISPIIFFTGPDGKPVGSGGDLTGWFTDYAFSGNKHYIGNVDRVSVSGNKAVLKPAGDAGAKMETVPERTEWKYGCISHKMIAMEAGHVCQNIGAPSDVHDENPSSNPF